MTGTYLQPIILQGFPKGWSCTCTGLGCNWTSLYHNLESNLIGTDYFSTSHPVKFNDPLCPCVNIKSKYIILKIINPINHSGSLKYYIFLSFQTDIVLFSSPNPSPPVCVCVCVCVCVMCFCFVCVCVCVFLLLCVYISACEPQCRTCVPLEIMTVRRYASAARDHSRAPAKMAPP